MSFAVGSLVKARGREWVVLPESDQDMLILRPLGGTEDEVAGIYLPLEKVEPAVFALPDPTQSGDERSGRLLRDAVRLGFRSSAGPFRSFAHLGVDPRPYQLVPLLMALKLDPVRLLIADDVGIGKTIEAGLIARELLDRGEVQRLAVLCPPHLAEQWQKELLEKFHIPAELVLASTAARLERTCLLGQTIFERYPYLIVSTDFIKGERRRDDFIRTCPELVIVDEAHTCADSGEGRGSRHQRYELVSKLSENPERHLLLVTATPHSGKEEAFRSLLILLNKEFRHLPEDLGGSQNERYRRQVAAQFVQRRRLDIRSYMEADTPFPDRQDSEHSYTLSPEYRQLFQRALQYTRELVKETADQQKHRQRVHWWSALALLRSLSSSPAAAAATLKNRSATAEAETVEEADAIGRHTVMDLVESESADVVDMIPGSDPAGETPEDKRQGRKLREMQKLAEELVQSGKDEKLKEAIKLIEGLLKEGYHPIVFCRFIPTAEYVAEALRKRLPKDVQVDAVTGLLPPLERENRILTLSESKRRVLVCTDCLSEGINLQEYFSAVLHYDLSWNPTRHEQREGRVDRYGQPRPQVKVLTYYGRDNQIDGIVLNVLINKHRKIRSTLGISVPVPMDTDQVIEAIFEGLLLREQRGGTTVQQVLPGMDDALFQRTQSLEKSWDRSAERERRSRTMFAQVAIKVEEVAKELQAARDAVGSELDVQHFTRTALSFYGATISPSQSNRAFSFDLQEVPRGLQDAVQHPEISPNKTFKARFELPIQEKEIYLSRTHPIVEGLATYVLDTALDPLGHGLAKRCGVIRTSKVEMRTTLLLVRLRYHIVRTTPKGEQPLLAEDCQLLAFTSSPERAAWLSDPKQVEGLLQLVPERNVDPGTAQTFLTRVIENYELLRPHLETAAKQRGDELLEAHRRVREASQGRGRYRVEPQLPVDVLGIYMYLPLA